MRDFATLFTSADPEYNMLKPLKRRNGPPPVDLLPSEEATADVHEGAQEAHGSLQANEGFDPRMALTGILGGLQDFSQPTAAPAKPMPFEMDGRAPATAYRGLRNGGIVNDGETVRVGEDGEEDVTKKPDGRVIVTPRREMPGRGDVNPVGEQYGLDQTIRDTPGQNPQAAMTENFGWNSDSQQMRDKREYNEQRPATLNEEYGALKEAQTIKPSPWKDVGAALVQGLNNWANPHQAQPIKTWGEIKADRKSAPILKRIGAMEGQQEFETKDLLNKARAQELTQRPVQREADRKSRENITATRAQQAVERLKLNADIASGTKHPFINDQGQLAYTYLKPDSNGKYKVDELELGLDGQPVTIPGEQPTQFFNPRTKKWETLKAKQAAIADTSVAGQDASREDTARRTNAEKVFESQRLNVANHLKWQDDFNGVLKAVIAADTTLENNAVIQGLNKQVQEWNDEAQALANEPTDSLTDEKAAETKAKRINELHDNITKAYGQITTEAEKSASGQSKAAELRKLLGAPPDKLTYTPYTPVQIGAIPKVSVNESEFTNKLKALNIPQSEWAARIAQAKHDGVLK